MRSNILVPVVLAGSVVGALALTGCTNEPSDGFKDRCKKAGGTIERENDNTLGMAPMAFSKPGVPAPPKPAAPAAKVPLAPKAPKVEIPKTPKLPKNDAPKSVKTPSAPRTPSKVNPTYGNGLALGSVTKGKTKKKSKHDDNDFLCVKDGELLFEEDE
ncbi:hypothetical protein FDI36_gp099 [Streptomyces phage NootNoot]|uniref:Lipoprotein n=1 Tax=Streptomyces phage NootNoot TaxID=2023992 RepID=A0A222YYP7_9CAUD|nr:hypothetical protein FDI36_gp099 [Streptomyces phage NootNoot]ASR77422.1 hypothetical protein SEA_NOOTNOOT_195 [Streptomyces phage NootNoot]